MLGILIALFLNDYRQDQSERAYIRSALQTILLEHTENIGEIEKHLSKQGMILDTLRYYLQDEQLSLRDISAKTGGIEIAIIRNTAWRSLLATNNHSLVDFKTISYLTEIEELKNIIDKTEDRALDTIYSFHSDRSNAVKATLFVIAGDMVYNQKLLLTKYEEFETHVKNHYNL